MEKDEGRRRKPEGVTLVCFALKEEAAPFRKLAAGRPDLRLLLTGIGRRNAEATVREALARLTPARVLTCGFAGGLNPRLGVGTVVFSVAEADEFAARLLVAGARAARFHCATRIATTAAEKRELRRTTAADAVEMESEAIHAVCRERQISCVTVRVISDAADEDLPLDFNQLAKPDLNLDYAKLALAIAKSPAKIGALLRLRKRTRRAAERLAAVLAQVTAS